MAHYDCSCCGTSMGISHEYCAHCKSGACGRCRVTYKAGDIVRWHDKWGVCSGYKFADVPEWEFFDDNDPEMIDTIGSVDRDISAPYNHTYQGIPETVLARATMHKLIA